MQKNLQRDFRDIRTEFDKLTAGQASELSITETFQRAALRLREIAAILDATSRPVAVSCGAGRGSVDRTLPNHDHAGLTTPDSPLSSFKRHIFVCINQRPNQTTRAAAARSWGQKRCMPVSRGSETAQSEGCGAGKQGRLPRPLRPGSQCRDLSRRRLVLR